MAIEAASYIVMEDATRAKKAGANVTEGQAVKINADGELEGATSAAKVYGICKLDSNTYRDLAFSTIEGYGTGQLTVITQGVLLLASSVYNKTEVDSSTTTSSAAATVKVFDDALTFAPGEALYIDALGLISNVKTNSLSLCGKVLRTPLQTGGFLEMEVNCAAATSAAELA